MSWDIFKSNMLIFMQGISVVDGEQIKSSKNVNSFEDFASKLTSEYDNCIRRGFQSQINKVPIDKPNTDMMENLLNIAFRRALQVSEGKHNIIDEIGKGVLAYWTAAELATTPPPFQLPTVPNAVFNVGTSIALVEDVGEWRETGEITPINDAEIFLDQLISVMKSHLPTLKGKYITDTLYFIGVGLTNAPGIVNWQGYEIIPVEIQSIPQPEPIIEEPKEKEKTVEELLEEIEDDNNTVEAAGAVVAEVGSTEVLSDEGQDAGGQLEQIKSILSKATPPPPPQSNTPQEVDGTNNLEGKTVQCVDEVNYEEQFTNDVRLRNLCLDCTFPHKLKAQRGLSIEDIVCNLKAVATNLVQPIKQKYPNVQINSGFRGTPSIPGGVSQHEKGEAIDVQFTGVTPLGYLEITKWIINNCAFDQIIFEHGKSIWLHISYKRSGNNRKKKLTMINGRYENGIKCYYNF